LSDIISGEPTLLQINVTNTGLKNYTILGMAGVLVNPNNFSQVLRNVRLCPSALLHQNTME